MDEFKVRLSRVRGTVQDQNNIAKQMRGMENDVRRICSGLNMKVAQSEQIKKRLKRAADNLSEEYNGLRKAAKALTSIANTYERTDLKLVGQKPKTGCIPPLTDVKLVLGVIPPLPSGAGISSFMENHNMKISVLPHTDDFDLYDKTLPIRTSGRFKDGETDFYKKGKVEESELSPVKLVNLEKKWIDDSLFSDETIIGDKDGSHIKTSIDVLKGEVKGELYGGLYTVDADGKTKINPAFGAAFGASVSGLTLAQEGQLGDNLLGLYVKTEETLGRLEGKAEAVAGLRDKDGDFNPTVHAEASAEAIAAEASVKGGAKVLGADVGVKGSVNVGVGAHAEVGFKDGKFSADIGASLGVGVGIKLEVDLSGVADAAHDVAKAIWPW